MSASREESLPLLTNVDDDELPPTQNPLQENEPPPYNENLIVTPMTADQSNRYTKEPLPMHCQPKHINIPIACGTLTPIQIMPAPPGWHEFVHPEGQKYFYNHQRRIITDSNIKEEPTHRLVLRAAGVLDARLNAQNLVLPTTTELTLEVDAHQETPSARYYFIDHNHKSEFWLEATTTNGLQLPPVTSATHLKLLFRQHYWTHIEFYPMHLSLSVEVEEELTAVLSHACIDYMTSNLSTIPYNQQQCESYLKLIRDLPESDRAEGYRNCILARLWSEIDGNYFVNLRGEDTPRLSRTQRLLPELQIADSRYIAAARALLLQSPDCYYNTLTELWVDKISYAVHWKKFIGSLMSEWKLTAIWNLTFLISASAIFAISIGSDGSNGTVSAILQVSSILAVMLSMLSLGASGTLVRMHRGHEDYSASETGDYLESHFHPRLGLQPLAIAYALPWGFCVWSFVFLSISILGLSFKLQSMMMRVIVWAFVISVSCAIHLLLRSLRGAEDDARALHKLYMENAMHLFWRMCAVVSSVVQRVMRTFFRRAARQQLLPITGGQIFPVVCLVSVSCSLDAVTEFFRCFAF